VLQEDFIAKSLSNVVDDLDTADQKKAHDD